MRIGLTEGTYDREDLGWGRCPCGRAGAPLALLRRPAGCRVLWEEHVMERRVVARLTANRLWPACSFDSSRLREA
jgi:hypothetical protein